MSIEPERIRRLNAADPRKNARYVLYRMQMNRRADSNHALAYAAELANAHNLPLLIYEDLTGNSPNDRIYTFMLQAVPGNAKAFRALHAGYVFCLRDVLHRIAKHALCVVTDDYPTLVQPEIGIPCYAVDSSCIVPMSLHDHRAYGAYTIRPKIKRELPRFLTPVELPRLRHRWKDDLLPPDLVALRTRVDAASIPGMVASCDIDHSVPPSISFDGGAAHARRHLEVFLENKLARYSGESNQPSKHATSHLSPWLHFGHISSLEVALAVQEYAAEHKLIADDFLEQLIVRRELAFNFARFASNVQSFDDLPAWCKLTMRKHAADPRSSLYTPEQLLCAETHDHLWNVSQKEMLLRGVIHGYYRMYWGKKIIEWSPTYEEALRTMIDIHDAYALDGRDPNTYANILWLFGLHDRPWGERGVFGQLRYMSYDGMKRKTDPSAYIQEIAQLEATDRDPFQI